MNILITLVVSLCFYVQDVFSKGNPVICITQIASHPSLDAIASGIKDTILKTIPNAQIYNFEAQAQISTAIQIARKCESMQADVIIPISTPSAQASFKHMGNKSLLVFAAVTDPVSAGLIKNIHKPQAKITGTIDSPNPYKQMQFFKKINPNIKNIVAIYNAAEQNSLSQIKDLITVAKKMHIKVTPQAVTKITEITSAMFLHTNADAFWVPNDNLVVSGIKLAIKAAEKMGKHLYVSDVESVEKGATAGFANDQYSVGVETGKLAIQMLEGKRNIPVVIVDAPTTLVSTNLKP